MWRHGSRLTILPTADWPLPTFVEMSMAGFGRLEIFDYDYDYDNDNDSD
ncbi:hypothetical protein [Desulfatirhabdium butyrativorans]|nr:hypothetical protein [Desulfatirhabdium butyrativorans]